MLKKHHKYKDVEMRWLNEIPSDWNFIRIKDIIRKIGSGVTPKGGSEIYVDSGITFLRSQNVYDDGLRIDNVSFITNEINENMKSSQIRPKDIVINITGASIGRSCIIPDFLKKANINQHMLFLRFKKNRVQYIAKYLKSNYIKEYINSVQAGTSKEALTMGQILYFPLLVPPEEEQFFIVNYLKQKTNAIDKKISLLETKITHYKELSKSLINEAVCRGLKKNVALKESGIEWIGKIPEHWEVKRVKDIFKIGRGRVIGQEELIDNGLFPVYSSQTENDGCLGYINSFDFKKPILTWTTDGVNAGTVFIRGGKFNCTNVCGTLHPKKSTSVLDYLKYSVQQSATHNKRIDTNGAKIMNNEMAVIHIVIPPLEEQTAIANYLDEKTNTIEAIVSNIKNQIEGLKELRKTLINDVVIGKLKVTE